MTKFLLDSGNPQEYKILAKLAQEKQSELWGATTNPTLIAKQLNGKKFSQKEAFHLQENIVHEILEIVPGIVSAEVYSDSQTTAESMIEQGRVIATWHKRIAVKLPTTVEGLKARTQLRKEKILINNTLVFSQEQVFAICLHEEIMQKQFGPIENLFPPFISPFVGRLDDIGLNGVDLITHSMSVKNIFTAECWILAASIRSQDHFTQGLACDVDLLTAPLKTYETFFAAKKSDNIGQTPELKPIPVWPIPESLRQLHTIDAFMQALYEKRINISHELTNKGIEKFVADWQTIMQ